MTTEVNQVREYKQYIGGGWAGSDKLFNDLDPYRGTVVARVPTVRQPGEDGSSRAERFLLLSIGGRPGCDDRGNNS